MIDASKPLTRLLFMTFCAAVLALVGCEPPNPNANTPTSGHLILFVDDEYAPLVASLIDTFKVRSPNARIDVRVVSARAGMQGLLDFRGAPTSDTSSAYAALIGRRLLPDERDVIAKAGLDLKEYVIAHDGLAVAVAASSPMQTTTVERLSGALKSSGGAVTLDSALGAMPLVFNLTDQNSSTFAVVRQLIGGGNVTAPAHYFATADSVLARVASGDGIAILPWTLAQRDSARVRTLRLGSIDSAGQVVAPVRVHPATLVTGAYPLKQSLIGYTFSGANSLAVGFLAWLSRSQDAQYYLARHGMQPENVKLRLVMPTDEDQ